LGLFDLIDKRLMASSFAKYIVGLRFKEFERKANQVYELLCTSNNEIQVVIKEANSYQMGRE
jgi:hypothetical protein